MDNDPPSLTHLTTFTSPDGPSTRLWQSTAHPSASHPLLATASSDKSIHLHSLSNFQRLSTISGGHKRSVRCVAWKDYGRPSKRARLSSEQAEEKQSKVTLATGSFDANVGIWDHNPNHNNPTSRADPDSLETDIAAEEEEQEEWHFSTLLTGPDSEIKSIAFSPPHYSANLLATSSRDKSVWVWEEVEDEEWETIAVLQEHAGDVKCVAWCEGAQLPSNTTDHDSNSDEPRIIGSREILASASYDDTIRLYLDSETEGDWTCVALLEGHAGTVWSVSWEKHINPTLFPSSFDFAADWEPRLLSCSDDLSIRVWRRELSEQEKEKKRTRLNNSSNANGGPQQRLPSIIRPRSEVETWIQEATLPSPHLRSVYAIDWSRHTGLVVSCGGDGTIAVYREVLATDNLNTSSSNHQPTSQPDSDGDIQMNGTVSSIPSASVTQTTALSAATTTASADSSTHLPSTWSLLATREFAHDEYEINHVCWAPRRDRDRRFEGEEVIVSTGDDGRVKIWCLPEELARLSS